MFGIQLLCNWIVCLAYLWYFSDRFIQIYNFPTGLWVRSKSSYILPGYTWKPTLICKAFSHISINFRSVMFDSCHLFQCLKISLQIVYIVWVLFIFLWKLSKQGVCWNFKISSYSSLPIFKSFSCLFYSLTQANTWMQRFKILSWIKWWNRLWYHMLHIYFFLVLSFFISCWQLLPYMRQVVKLIEWTLMLGHYCIWTESFHNLENLLFKFSIIY